MITKQINVPIYNFLIEIIELYEDDDKSAILDVLKSHQMSEEDIQSVVTNIEKKCDGADTFRNLIERKFLMIIYHCQSIEKRREIINHEKRHIEDRILEYCGIDDIESAGYLAGYLSKFIY